MVKVSASIFIKAPRDKVFNFVSRFEEAPKFSTLWKSVKLFSREGMSAIYDTEAEAEGRRLKAKTKMTLFPPERIETETVDGDGKGTKTTMVFIDSGEGTQVEFEGEMVLPGFAKMLPGALVKGRIESSLEAELDTIRKAIEGQ